MGYPRGFADTIDRTYDNSAWMPDDRFQDAISDTVDEFLGKTSEDDFY